jgi:hypothetical protein
MDANPSSSPMSVTTLHRPAHRDALALFETAFDAERMVTAFGRCTVDYDGRASSDLGPGDRLVVCKPDGTVLVTPTRTGHRSTGSRRDAPTTPASGTAGSGSEASAPRRRNASTSTSGGSNR